MRKKYIISEINPTNGAYNFYHDEMRGSLANILLAEVGERADIRYSQRHDDIHRNVSTSPVKSITEDGSVLTIETNNTIYTLHAVEDAEFTSVWDGGFAVTTGCKVNMATKEVFDIETSEDMADEVDVLDEEYVTINGEDFPVTSDEDMDESPKESGEYWYRS